MAQVIINQAGPLPIDVNVQTGASGPATLVMSGSAWSEATNVMLEVDVLVDGGVVGTARIFSNGPSTHRALVPIHIPIDLEKPFSDDQPPSYQFTLAAHNGNTITDVNDWFQVVLAG